MSPPGHPENVLAFPRRDQAGRILPACIGALQDTVAQLDEMAFALCQLSPHVGWSGQHCMIASTPLRMMLTIARKKTNEVIISGLPDDQDDARWSLEFNDAFLEVSRRLHEVEVCLHTLQSTEISLAERGQRTEIFVSIRSELLTAMGELSRLIHRSPIGTRRGPRVVGARRELNSDLSDIGQRLQAFVATYEEKQDVLDNDIIKSENHELGVAMTIAEIYQVMIIRVYSEASPLRVDNYLWEALREQKSEFMHFHRSAEMGLEIYQRVLKAYHLLEGKNGPRLQRGSLEGLRQDTYTHVKERARCIEAVSDFERKFTATVSVLCADQRN